MDPATLPENRPEQALRCTNNSVLMITRRHLDIQDHGEPGNRLGKTWKSGIGEINATQATGEQPVVGNTEARVRKDLFTKLIGLSSLKPAVVENKSAGYMPEGLLLRPTVGNNGVGYRPEESTPLLYLRHRP